MTVSTSGLPLISVYIPTCDRRLLLTRAVQSVLDQTYPEIEVVVADDCSTDDTRATLQAWAARDARVRYVATGRRSGAPAARNLAIRASRGAFVTGLDDDDVFLPDRLVRFFEFWSAHCQPLDDVFLYARSRLVGPGRRAAETGAPAEASVDLMCKSNCVGNQVFAPKRLYERAGGFTEGLPAWQDMDLWLSMLRQGSRGLLVDAVTMEVDVTPRPGRITGQARAKIEAARDSLVRRHDWLVPAQRRDLYLQVLSPHYGFAPSCRDYVRAMRLDPSMATARRLASLTWRRMRGR